MVCSDVPGLTVDAVKFIESNLWLNCSDNEATARFSRMILQTIGKVLLLVWEQFYHHLKWNYIRLENLINDIFGNYWV